MDVPKAKLDEFVDACRRAGAAGLMRCSSGNFSLRLDEERMLIKCSRSWMARVTPEDASLCRIADGAHLAGRKPSVELGFHAGILRERPGINCVLHFQTTCATALACQPARDVDYFVIPEIPYYIGPIGRVPYLPPGSPELARAVTEVMRTRNLAQMTSHGQVTAAADPDHAIQNALFFELACELIVRSNGQVEPLTAEAKRDLLAAGQSGGAA